jgi:mannosyl-3-phosphoglycerate phosphatase
MVCIEKGRSVKSLQPCQNLFYPAPDKTAQKRKQLLSEILGNFQILMQMGEGEESGFRKDGRHLSGLHVSGFVTVRRFRYAGLVVREGAMKLGIILTDLDGTLLQGGSPVAEELRPVLDRLASLRILVCPVTSKTPAELGPVTAYLGLSGSPCGFENGAGVLDPDGTLFLLPKAVPSESLRAIAEEMRERTGVPFRMFHEIPADELRYETGLNADEAEAAKQRWATLPLFVDSCWDAALRESLPRAPALQLLRGNRFLHLQGMHDKSSVVPLLIERAGAGPPVVALGDSPNDLGMLLRSDIPVIVPGPDGMHPSLKAKLPHALLAPETGGRGWARVISRLLDGGYE